VLCGIKGYSICLIKVQFIPAGGPHSKIGISGYRGIGTGILNDSGAPGTRFAQVDRPHRSHTFWLGPRPKRHYRCCNDHEPKVET